MIITLRYFHTVYLLAISSISCVVKQIQTSTAPTNNLNTRRNSK